MNFQIENEFKISHMRLHINHQLPGLGFRKPNVAMVITLDFSQPDQTIRYTSFIFLTSHLLPHWTQN